MLGNKILTVCIGNICRSPAAEGFFSRYFKEKNITCDVASAGIEALVDRPADPLAQDVMRETYQIDISDHRARQFSEQIAREYDLILVMDDSQVQYLQSRYPFASGKIHLLGKWRQASVGDPYRQSKEIFQKRIALINDCVNDWVQKFW